MGTYALPRRVNLSFNAGAQLDRTRYAVKRPSELSANDRIAAGLSSSNAVLLGVMASRPFAGWMVSGEWSWDVAVGSSAPSVLVSPMRVEVGVQRTLLSGFFAGALLGASPSTRPRANELARIEPRVWAMLTLGFAFDGRERVTPKPAAAPTTPKVAAPVAAPPPEPMPEPGPSLPAGQIRGRVRSLRGKALRAQIEVLPLGQKMESDATGAFVIDVPPGRYNVVVRAEGHETQERPAEVEQNGVTILVIDLRRSEQ